eukprot:COSAG01_NODE_7652_length_3113_cov_4.134373_2_plen_72_part_01
MYLRLRAGVCLLRAAAAAAAVVPGVRGEGVRRGNYPCLIEKLTPRLVHADPRAANVGCQHAPLVHVGLHAHL